MAPYHDDAAKQNRRNAELDERRRDREPEDQRRQAPPEPPAPDTLAWHEAQTTARREELANARDLRSSARQEVDRVWSGMREACIAKFGRAPSTESWNQPNDELTVALANAEREGEALLRAADAPGASPAFVEAARCDLRRRRPRLRERGDESVAAEDDLRRARAPAEGDMV